MITMPDGLAFRRGELVARPSHGHDKVPPQCAPTTVVIRIPRIEFRCSPSESSARSFGEPPAVDHMTALHLNETQVLAKIRTLRWEPDGQKLKLFTAVMLASC